MTFTNTITVGMKTARKAKMYVDIFGLSTSWYTICGGTICEVKYFKVKFVSSDWDNIVNISILLLNS